MGPLTPAAFDSNILIDELLGYEVARDVLLGYRPRFVSIITWIEVMCGTSDNDERLRAETLLADFTVVSVEPAIAAMAVAIRRERRLKLPDAIILATARHLKCPFVTRNTKDFDASDPEILVPYTL